jgi:hypothetical protein
MWALLESPFGFCNRVSCKTYTNAKQKELYIQL